MELGQTIRERRIQRGLTLDMMAAETGVSRAMLSDIERGVKNPTIKVLCQIAEGLQCSVSALLGEERQEAGEQVEIVRKSERRVLVDVRTGVERHLLAPAFVSRGIEVVWYEIPPGQKTGAFPPHRAGVKEQITVVQGQLHCFIGSREVVLEQGDAASFRGDVTHEFYNAGTEMCRYFLIIDAGRGET